jgi:hypothetical protein
MSSHRRTALTALALGVAVAVPLPAAFAHDFAPPSGRTGALDASPSPPQGRHPRGVTGRLASWVTAADDNGDLPFMIVDKLGARIFAFDARGRFLGSAPVLVGLARGDDSAPGIGDLKLAQISVDQRTTPAGRFVARFGAAEGHGTVLWVDPRDGIALHPVMSVSASEHRLQRIESSDPKQHRISYGCINVPATFYDDVVLPVLAGGDAVVYVLPDTKDVDEVFPAFAAAPGGGHDGEPPRQRIGRARQVADVRLNPPTSE